MLPLKDFQDGEFSILIEENQKITCNGQKIFVVKRIKKRISMKNFTESIYALIMINI